jgi:signal transduction histidine kinase
MHHRRFKRLFHSVFTKLLVTILVAGTAITLTVLVGFALIRFHSLSHLDRNLLLYAEYLTRDLGDPPDFDRAKEIARRTGLAIRFDHPNRTWQTAKVPESMQLDRARVRRHGKGVYTGHHRGHFFIRLNHGGGELMFITPREAKDHENAGWFLASMAAVLFAILAAAYFYIRRVLAPLHPLETGVKALAAGRLDHRVAKTGADEFRDLAEAFNTMAKRLSEQLTSKEHLLLDMSHELRSPLTRLKVQLEFVPDEEIRESLRADVAEMESMVTAILEEARLRSSSAVLNLEKVELTELIRSITNDFKDRSPGLVCGALAPVHVRADREKMRMVLRNLLDNALKHTPKGGDPVAISLAKQKNSVDIAIEDHGEGIPEAALPHLFEPFFRSDSSRSRKTGGYGLGLSLCKAVIDAHKGRIDISSVPGKGTRVLITLLLP